MTRLRLGALSLVAALACSREEPPPERTEPWPAKPPEAPASLSAKYVIESASATTFGVSTRKQKNTGSLPIAKGSFEVDLLDLTKTTGSVSVDVGAIRFSSFDDDRDNRAQAQRARSWLDVGASRPEAVREKARWARFTITKIEKPSATAAHLGKKQKRPRPSPLDAGDAGDASLPSPDAEVRRVTFDAVGDLLFHSYRVEAVAKLNADFFYEDGASFDTKPVSVRIHSRSPLRVSLAAHDIKPRDSKGVVLSAELPILKRQVGREARVTVDVRAKLRP